MNEQYSFRNLKIQKIKWNDAELTADVYDTNNEFVRNIKYTQKEYDACKNLYYIAGGRNY